MKSMEILTGFIYLLAFLGFVKFMDSGGFNFKKRYLLKHGISTVAKVNSIKKTIFSIGDDFDARPIMKIVLDIEIADVAFRQVTITHSFNSNPPQAGDKVIILIDPRDPDNVMLSLDQKGLNSEQ